MMVGAGTQNGIYKFSTPYYAGEVRANAITGGR